MIKKICLCIWLVALPTMSVAASKKSLVSVFKKVDPAVVVLKTVERQVVSNGPRGEVALPGLGSGVLIDKEGHVITAAHVVQAADFVEAEFVDGRKIPAAVIASDPLADLALIRLDVIPDDVRPVKLGDSDNVNVGDEVFVVGAPYGLGHSLTVGHISGRHVPRADAMGGVEAELFQTDASINQGNSGGPMFNMDGEVIGIVSYILSKSGGFEGLGFVVTSNATHKALFEHRIFWSGMTGIMLTGPLAKAFNLPVNSGYLVQRVAHNSPAERLGLHPSSIPVTIGDRTFAIGGDVVLGVDGIPLSRSTLNEIREHLSGLGEQQLVKVQILRSGEQIELSAVR